MGCFLLLLLFNIQIHPHSASQKSRAADVVAALPPAAFFFIPQYPLFHLPPVDLSRNFALSLMLLLLGRDPNRQGHSNVH
jgi:hypothetical protein